MRFLNVFTRKHQQINAISVFSMHLCQQIGHFLSLLVGLAKDALIIHGTNTKHLLQSSDHATEPIPESTAPNKTGKLDALFFGFQGIAHLLAEGLWNIAGGEIPDHMTLGTIGFGCISCIRIKQHGRQPERKLHFTERFDLNGV